jgi:hypothetical protein
VIFLKTRAINVMLLSLLDATPNWRAAIGPRMRRVWATPRQAAPPSAAQAQPHRPLPSTLKPPPHPPPPSPRVRLPLPPAATFPAGMAADTSPATCARASASGLRTGRLAVRAAALPADGRGGDGAASYKKLGTSATRSFMRILGRMRKKPLNFVMPSVQCGVNWTNWERRG